MPFTPEAWEKSFGVNLRGPVFLVQAALPYLKESPYGAVVNLLSAGAFLPATNVPMYSAAKAGMHAFTRVDGARMGTVRYPGERARARHRRHRHGAQQPARGAGEHGEGAARWRRAAHADEMVGPALLLVSDAGSFITGAVLAADGGLVMR